MYEHAVLATLDRCILMLLWSRQLKSLQRNLNQLGRTCELFLFLINEKFKWISAIVSGPKGHSKGEWVHKFYLEESCSESDNMQIKDFKWKALPRVLLCSSASKSLNWSWGNSSLFLSRSSMEKGCIEGETQVLLISSAFISCLFPQSLFCLFPHRNCFSHRQKFWGRRQIPPLVFSLSQFCWKGGGGGGGGCWSFFL